MKKKKALEKLMGKEKPIVKRISIASQKWDLVIDKNEGPGGRFVTIGPNGCGEITICAKGCDARRFLEILTHEILEALFCMGSKRVSPTGGRDNDTFTFIFDHNFLDTLGPQVVDALISSGMIEESDENFIS